MTRYDGPACYLNWTETDPGGRCPGTRAGACVVRRCARGPALEHSRTDALVVPRGEPAGCPTAAPVAMNLTGILTETSPQVNAIPPPGRRGGQRAAADSAPRSRPRSAQRAISAGS